MTRQQLVIHTLFERHRSMSIVSRVLGVSQIRVREALVQYERNQLRDAGIKPPSLKEMQRGDVTPRFGVPRKEFGGRPATHVQLNRSAAPSSDGIGPSTREVRHGAVPDTGIVRFIVTAVEPNAEVHQAFWANLKAYAAASGAEIVVGRVGASATKADMAAEHASFVPSSAIHVRGLVSLAMDEAVPARQTRPLAVVRNRNVAQWTVIPHPVVALETMSRVRADGLKVQLTTGSMTMPRPGPAGSIRELGAVIVEVGTSGRAHCRHILTPAQGDGSFQDLDALVSNGGVRRGATVEAITFGDVHHACIDPIVAASTWGIGGGSGPSLIDRLRPRFMVFHDVCDFAARSAFDARDHHKRFAQLVAGGGDVAAELAGATRFLEQARREWAQSIVVGSNHDDGFVRWLREADFRDDPTNAIFYLESSLELHRRLASGHQADGFFEQTLRRLSHDGLRGVRFLRPGEGFKIAGIEQSIHGHLGADGRQANVRVFENLGIKATIGHTHRPATRDDLYCAGVCNTELEYARGAITSWAVGHVVTYPSGSRQHLLFSGGAFHG